MNLLVLSLGVLDVPVRNYLESTPMLPTTMTGSMTIVTIVLTNQFKKKDKDIDI